jgi:hypothetical protein
MYGLLRQPAQLRIIVEIDEGLNHGVIYNYVDFSY